MPRVSVDNRNGLGTVSFFFKTLGMPAKPLPEFGTSVKIGAALKG
jgi:hypothetical protein